MFGKKEEVQNGPEINDVPKQKKPIFKKWWFWVVIVLLVVVFANDNIATFSFITVSDGQYLTVNNGKFIEAAKAEVPAADNGIYSSGTYRVGTDIQAGEYKVTCTSSSAYVEVCKDSTGAFDSIVANDNIENSGYITVSDGQYLTVNGGEFSAA